MQAPSPALAPHVELLWSCEAYTAPHRYERVMPSGKVQLIFDLANEASEPLAVGLQSRFETLDTWTLRSIVGAVLRPGGSRALFDEPSDALRDREVPLEDAWGTGVRRLRERLREAAGAAERFAILDAWLTARAARGRELHPAVRFGVDAFASRPDAARVTAVARESGWSRRRFADLFREQVGMAPKMYCRVLRFQSVVRQVNAGAPVDWAAVAAAGGYFDQSHMANEFREFSGLTPCEFLASARPFANHVAMP